APEQANRRIATARGHPCQTRLQDLSGKGCGTARGECAGRTWAGTPARKAEKKASSATDANGTESLRRPSVVGTARRRLGNRSDLRARRFRDGLSTDVLRRLLFAALDGVEDLLPVHRQLHRRLNAQFHGVAIDPQDFDDDAT